MTIHEFNHLMDSLDEGSIDESFFRDTLRKSGIPDAEIQKLMEVLSGPWDVLGFKLGADNQINGFEA